MLPPVNLLAAEATAFDAEFTTGPGIPAENGGFNATFAGALQFPMAASGGPARHPQSESGTLRLFVGDGQALPQGGKGLPLQAGAEESEEQAVLAGLLAGLPALSGHPSLSNDKPQPAAAASIFPAPSGNAPATGVAGSLAPPVVVTAPQGGVPGDAAAQTLLAGGARYFGSGPAPSALAGTDALADALAIDAGSGSDADSLRSSQQALAPASVGAGPLSSALVTAVADAVSAGTGSPAAIPEPGQPADTLDLRAAVLHGRTWLAAASTPAPAGVAQAQVPDAAVQWATSHISASPGQAGWNDALGDRVVWMAGNKVHNAELRLNPSELGPVRVQISIDDGQATVNFTAQHPVTRDAIEQALPRLREMLADQGLVLQGTSVGEQGTRQEQYPAGRHAHAPRLESGESVPEERGAVAGASPAGRAPAGLVDTFA